MGAWIETFRVIGITLTLMSRPAWARGLKHQKEITKGKHWGVAPCVGAWIETDRLGIAPAVFHTSRPAWARGLKLGRLVAWLSAGGRALRGRVD